MHEAILSLLPYVSVA